MGEQAGAVPGAVTEGGNRAAFDSIPLGELDSYSRLSTVLNSPQWLSTDYTTRVYMPTIDYRPYALEVERLITERGMKQDAARAQVKAANPALSGASLRRAHNKLKARGSCKENLSNSTVDSAWGDVLARLRRDKRFVTVSHVCDVHYPEHDSGALDLAYRLIARKQPDVIVVGSDTADFGVISTFDPIPDEQEAIDDVLDNFRRHWQPHIDSLRSAAPKAALVFIEGNHESRIHKHIEQQAPKLRKTIERVWVDTITYGGRVLYPGRVSEVEIGNLLVKHGDVAGEHPAKKMLENESFQISIMSGHVHRPTSYTRRGRRYEVSAITSGCLCKLDPAYAKGKRQNWQHGTAFANTEINGVATWFDNITFRESGSKLLAFADGSVLEQGFVAA